MDRNMVYDRTLWRNLIHVVGCWCVKSCLQI